jgi:hypothetical protein
MIAKLLLSGCTFIGLCVLLILAVRWLVTPRKGHREDDYPSRWEDE